MLRKMSMFLSMIALCVWSIQAATISGVVKEGDSTGAVIDSAIVTLTTTGAAGVTLRDTTGADGAFSFAAVRVGTPRVSVAKTGYSSPATSTIAVTDSTAAYTRNLYLVKIVYGSITGTVTDSVAAMPIAGAKVYLRTTGGGGGTLLDSATTAADGSYSIAHVQSGIARSLSAQMTGFISKTSTVTVIGTAALTANFQLAAILYGSITGMVTDSVAATPIVGAKVYLRTTGGGGGTLLDSATSAADGSYSIAHVQSGIARSLSAQMTGFITKTSTVTVVGTAALTANFQLIAIVYGSITGMVTDSVAATPIAGAKVYLRTTGGGFGTLLDSATTAADGSYSIAHVQSGIARSLSAQMTGFITKTSTVTVVGTAALTANFQLIAILYGSITGMVTDSVAATPIVGAKVYLRTTGGGGGTLLDSATTAADGSYTIAHVQSGIARSLSAQMTGFISKTSTVTVIGTAALTANFQLIAILYGSITGMVTDSVAATPIAGAKVYLRTTGGAGTILDSATTAADGSYSIAHVQSGIARTLRAQATGFVTKNATVTVAGTAALVVNFALRASTSSILPLANKVQMGTPQFGVSAGMLRLNNFADPGVVSVFDLNGRLLYHGAFQAHATSLALPAQLSKSGNAYIIGITQNSAVYRKQVMVP